MPWEFFIKVREIIRDILVEKGECYEQQLHKLVKERQHPTRWHRGTYNSFRANYIALLAREGLIVKTRTEKSSVKGFHPRQYWKIAPGKEKDEGWYK